MGKWTVERRGGHRCRSSRGTGLSRYVIASDDDDEEQVPDIFLGWGIAQVTMASGRVDQCTL